MASQAIKGFSILGMARVGLLVVSLAGTPSAHAQSGGIQADKLVYNTLRTHYYSVGDGDINPGTHVVGYTTASGHGGTYITTAGSSGVCMPGCTFLTVRSSRNYLRMSMTTT